MIKQKVIIRYVKLDGGSKAGLILPKREEIYFDTVFSCWTFLRGYLYGLGAPSNYVLGDFNPWMTLVDLRRLKKVTLHIEFVNMD